MPMDENRVLLTGENPFIRLNAEGPDGEATTNASFWRILYWCARNRLPVRPLPNKTDRRGLTSDLRMITVPLDLAACCTSMSPTGL